MDDQEVAKYPTWFTVANWNQRKETMGLPYAEMITKATREWVVYRVVAGMVLVGAIFQNQFKTMNIWMKE